MPRFDGTGPMGQGSMTGGGRGYCAVNLSGMGARRFAGRGFSGRGGGSGHRNCFYATGFLGWMHSQKGMSFGFAQGRQEFGGVGRGLSKDDELSVLKGQADYLNVELEATQARVRDLETK